MTRTELLAANARGILMSTPMVQATFEDQKGRTMRVIKGYLNNPARAEISRVEPGEEFSFYSDGRGLIRTERPRHHPGDIVYVKEKHRFTDIEYIDGVWSAQVKYAADESYRLTRLFWKGENDIPRLGWRPSIFMPKAAARIFLRITGVKAQRPQELTLEEIQAEGVPVHKNSSRWNSLHAMREVWARLWNSVQSKKGLALYGYDANPRCWVYEFERVVPE